MLIWLGFWEGFYSYHHRRPGQLGLGVELAEGYVLIDAEMASKPLAPTYTNRGPCDD
jgi:hypothetical protein